jgi:hypothetical protein
VGGGEVNRQGVGSKTEVGTGENRIRPGRENAPRSTISIGVDRVVETVRKKEVELLSGDVSQLSFLEEDQIRIRGKKFRKDIATLHIIIQTSNIPAAYLDASVY